MLLSPTSADFELAQLQERLRETEMVMENIVSNAHHSPDRWVSLPSETEFVYITLNRFKVKQIFVLVLVVTFGHIFFLIKKKFRQAIDMKLQPLF